MFLGKWHVFQELSLCLTLWKTMTFKLLSFQNETRYRAENMQIHIFLKLLHMMKTKIKRLFSFVFTVNIYDVKCNPK